MLNHVARNLFAEFLHEEGAFRPRSHQAHIALQDIEKLGHLIDTGFPDEGAHLRHPGIAGRCPLMLFLLRRLQCHGAELVHLKGLVVQSHPLLAEDHRSFGCEFHRQGRQNHHRREQYNRHQGAEDIDGPLDGPVQKIGQRHMSYIDDRKSFQILHIGLGRNKPEVIGDKLGMHAGLLAGRHNLFQMGVLPDSQGDGDLIQRIQLQNPVQVADLADHPDAAVFSAPFRLIIQDAAHLVSPLGIGPHPVDKALCRPAVSHEQHMLLVISLRPHGPEA